jgi:hypothetical protein
MRGANSSNMYRGINLNGAITRKRCFPSLEGFVIFKGLHGTIGQILLARWQPELRRAPGALIV